MPLQPKSSRRGARHGAWILGFGLALGCSSGNEVTAPTRQAIAGGKADDSHVNVFLLASHFNGGGGLCTATLIAPNLLLTARHCVSPTDGSDHVTCGESALGEPYPAKAFVATNDAKPSASSPLFRAVEVKVPDIGSDTCGFDIALIILDQNVPAALAKPAVPRIDREVMPGELYTAVGYGENDAGLPTATRLEREGLSIACQPGSCGEGVESTEFRGETGICSGDSGGPALDSDGKVVGVVSRGGPDCDTPVYGTVTAWHDLLIDTATHAASLGSYEPPYWVTTGSSEAPPELGSGGTGSNTAGAAGTSEAPTCTSTTDCADGLVCEPSGETSRCVAPAPHTDGGCSLSAGSRGGVSAVGLLLGAAWLLRKRRASQRDH